MQIEPLRIAEQPGDFRARQDEPVNPVHVPMIAMAHYRVGRTGRPILTM